MFEKVNGRDIIYLSMLMAFIYSVAVECHLFLCHMATYKEMFSQFRIPLLALMLLVGPGIYIFKNRPDSRELIEAMVLMAACSALFYFVFYIVEFACSTNTCW
jgi:hypothetical protein